MGSENERDEAKVEAQVLWLAVVVAGDAKAQVKNELARVQDALAVAEEAKRKVEAEAAHLEVEQTSLLW